MKHHYPRSPAHAVLVLLSLLLVAPLAAQEPVRPDPVVPLEGVVVSAVRPATTTGGSSAVVVSPDSLAVVPAPTLEEVLREIPFVRVRQNSRGQAEITVRGSDSRQVAVLLDGIPLTLGWDHRADPSVVPVTGARSVTSVRGLHSMLYGPNVLGGVVEIGVSASPGAPPRPPFRAGIGVDHLGGTTASITSAAGIETLAGELDLVAGAGFRGRRGVAVAAAADDTLTGDPDLRANSDLRHLDAFVGARYDALTGHWMGVTASGYTARRGVPPELHVREPRLWRYPHEARGLLVLSGGTGERRTAWGAGDVEVSIGVDASRSEIESFASAAYADPIDGESARGRTITARLLGDHTLFGGTATASATYADVRHRERIGDRVPAEYRQRLWSAATELTLPTGADTRLSGGFAIDGADTPTTGGRPPLGALSAWGGRLGASTLLDGRSRLHAAVTRRARFPSLRELYSGALGRFDPNPALRPETLLGGEAGITANLGLVEVQAVAFRHHLRDAVVRTITADGLYRRENRNAIRSFGLELLGDATLGGVGLRGDLMVQSVSLSAGAEGAGRRPEHQPPVRASAAADIPLPLRMRGSVQAAYTASQYCLHPDTGDDVRLSSGGTLDAGIRRVWRHAGTPLRVSAHVENAIDVAAYDQCGLPRPGRTLRFSIELG